MSLNDETVVEESTEIETNLEQTSAEVTSEQPKSEDNQGVATEGNETEQAGKQEDDFNLGDVLSGKAEPEDEKPSKTPRSTIKARRKSKRLERELEVANKQLDQLRNSRAPEVKAQIPERDWDNETEEQFNFRSMQAVLGHQQQVNNAGEQYSQRVRQAGEGVAEQQKVIDQYSEVVDKLNLANYDDAESRVLDAMPEGSLTYMSKMNPEATAKIIFYLDHNPDKLAEFADLAHNNANGFNYQFGKLETAINQLETKARKKQRSLSKAPADKGLAGSGSANTSIDKKMLEAANNGNIKLYRQLKAEKHSRPK